MIREAWVLQLKSEVAKECKSEVDKANHLKNRESRIEKMKKYYENNKEVFLEDCKKYREANKEKIAEYKKEWAVKNKEKKQRQEKAWRENNKEKNAEKKSEWYRNNKSRVFSNLLKRRSSKHFVRFEGVRRRELLERDNWKCQCCGVKVHDRSEGGNENRHLWDDEFKAHIDHIIPISKGGDSSPDNLQVLCRTCNLSKKDKISF
ncbi:HNH endonuclease [Priestia flexa]|uniref:HNH endonuclease n=1 Tax=Priestia flexa TaxID=86664 RepID=UPI003D00F5BC